MISVRNIHKRVQKWREGNHTLVVKVYKKKIVKKFNIKEEGVRVAVYI